MARPAKRGTVRDQLINARAALRASGNDDDWLDAEVLLAHVLDVDRAWLHGHPERQLTASQRQRFRRLVDRRGAHVPIAYLTGRKEFYGHNLHVSPAVLIPRPESELLVDLAVDWLRARPAVRKVIDLGTGSGAIAIAIAKAVRSVRVIGIDADVATLSVAAENVIEQRLVSRVELKRGDLLRSARPADLIVANLPYLSAARRRSAGPELSYEPKAALDGGTDGLDLIRRAMQQAPSVMRAHGCLLFEFDPGQSRRIERLAKATWPGASVVIRRDLAGRDRVLQIQLP